LPPLSSVTNSFRVVFLLPPHPRYSPIVFVGSPHRFLLSFFSPLWPSTRFARRFFLHSFAKFDVPPQVSNSEILFPSIGIPKQVLVGVSSPSDFSNQFPVRRCLNEDLPPPSLPLSVSVLSRRPLDCFPPQPRTV